MSFYSKSLYQDVGMNWRKISYLYLLLILSVCLIPSMFKTRGVVSDYLAQKAPGIVKQVPVILISKGQVSVDIQMPYLINDPDSKKPLIIIDTTGQTASLKGSPALVLLTKKELLLKKSDTESRTFDLSGIDTLTIDQSTVYSWIETFLDYFVFVLFPLALLFSFSFRIIQTLIFSLVGMALAKNLKIRLKVSSLVSLAIVSMTPAIILDAVHNYVDVTIPSWWLIDFLVAMGYLFFAVKAVAEKQGSETSGGS